MMKKMKKQILAGLLTAVMAVSAFASATPAQAASLSARQYLTKMTKATEKAKSYELKMNMDMDMSMQGQTASAKTTTTSIVFTNPMKMKTVVNMSVSAAGEKSTKSKSITYAKQKGDQLLVYTSSDGKKYDKTKADLSEYTDMISSLPTTDMYSDVKLVKNNVTVNGKSTAQIKAEINGEGIATLMSGVLGSDSSTDTSYDYSSLSPITVSIWIDKKTYRPVKQTIEMTDFINEYLAALGMDSLSYPKIKISATYKNFNNATKFSLPKNCK